MQNIRRVDVLKPSQDLVYKVTNVVFTETLGLEELVKVGFHQGLHYVACGRQGNTNSNSSEGCTCNQLQEEEFKGYTSFMLS